MSAINSNFFFMIFKNKFKINFLKSILFYKILLIEIIFDSVYFSFYGFLWFLDVFYRLTAVCKSDFIKSTIKSDHKTLKCDLTDSRLSKQGNQAF